MRLECPHCHAVFEVPEALLDHARRLRCANCGESWEIMPSEPEVQGAEGGDQGVAQSVAPEGESDELQDNEAVSLKPQSVGVCSLAAREIERRQAVLHSRSSVGAPTGSEPMSRKMIGSTGRWLAAWGVSLAMVGGGAVAAWHWKAGELVHLWPGVGHFVSP